MIWERFGYICRKATGTMRSDESASECISRIESEPSCRLYGDRIGSDSFGRKILNDVGKIRDNDKARRVLGVYGDINLSQHLSEPLQFKRVTAYLAYVTVVFLMVSAIYQFRVAPAFLEAFETFDLSIPPHLLFYRDYWQLPALVISLLLVGSLIVGYTLKGLFRFRQGLEDGLVLRYLAFKGIRESYLRIVDALYFPILSAMGSSTQSESEIVAHLSEIENSDMNLAVEIEALVRQEVASLQSRCERQMRLVSVLVAVIVVAAIFFFLVSAYSPIFILGETV